MRHRVISFLAFFLIIAGLIGLPIPVGAQVPLGGASIPGHAPLGELKVIEKHTWNIFGKVTDLKGQALRGASVHVDIAYGPQYVKDLTTDVQGQYQTTYNLDAQSFSRISATILVKREGYRDSREFVDFGNAGKTWGIDVVMREVSDSTEELTSEVLINELAPQLRADLAKEAGIESARKDFNRGAQEFLDSKNSIKAVPYLDKVVKRHADCGRCRLLLGLVLLDSGSWTSAWREFGEAASVASGQSDKKLQADTLLVLGVIENWKGGYDKAAGFLMQAKDLDPQNAFVLQELGRTLVFQKNWEAADGYLDQAIRAGASPDTRLLRVRALLEQGSTLEAEKEMQQYLGDRDIRTLPTGVRSLYSQLQTYVSLLPYGKVQSFVTQSVPELVKAMPELAGLTLASSQDELFSVLQKTGRNIEAMFRGFPNTVSHEEIRQERQGKGGKVKNSLDQSFQYLLLARPEKWGFGLEEYRTNSRGDRGSPVGLKDGLMLTSGFASAPLLFHPAYQSGSTFRYLGRETLDGVQMHVIAFAQRPETAKMIERFNTDEASVLILLQGVAWIDASNYQIVRMRSDLLMPSSNIRLERQTTEIQFEHIPFRETATALWLPHDVAVTVNWKGKTFLNRHRYSDFKFFNVETKEQRKDPTMTEATQQNQ